MTVRGTLGLAALFLALLGWIRFVELPTPPPPADRPAPLLSDSLDRIAEIDLTGDRGTFAATRVASEWLNPKGAPWPNGVIEDLLRVLTELRPLRTIAGDPNEGHRYAVGQRRLKLLRHDGSTALDLELGNLNPTGTALYARRTDQTDILLVGSVLQWELGKIDRVARPSAPPES